MGRILPEEGRQEEKKVVENSPMDASGAPLTEQAKQQAQKVVQQTQQKAGEALGQAGNQIKSRLTEQKDTAAGGLESVAMAVRQTGQHLREQELVALSGYADKAAEAVEELTGYLRRTDVDEFVGQAERFARSQPALFLGSVFLLGFLTARFLKSSARDGGANGMSGGATDPLLPAPIYEPAPELPVSDPDPEMRTFDDASSTTSL